MAKNQSTPPKNNIFANLADEIKLVIRLMMDGRVNPLLKLLPIGTLIYFFIPDLIVGPIDDALIVGVGTYLFIELCPPALVDEHREAIKYSEEPSTNFKEEPEDKRIPIYEDEIIEGEFRDE